MTSEQRGGRRPCPHCGNKVIQTGEGKHPCSFCGGSVSEQRGGRVVSAADSPAWEALDGLAGLMDGDAEAQGYIATIESGLAAAEQENAALREALSREIRHRFTEHEGWPGDLDDAVEAELARALTTSRDTSEAGSCEEERRDG